MVRSSILTGCFLALLPALAPAADPGATPSLSAAQIVDRNIAARGGLSGWRGVKSLTWSGKMDAGGNNRQTLPSPGPRSREPLPPARPAEQVQLPFVMELERPRKSRLEITFAGQTAIQVYDGTRGWKLRPYLNRHEVEKFSAEELKASEAQSDLDGPLVDYAAKGTSIAVSGTEKVEGNPAYKLTLTLKDKQVQHVWIDAKSFLEVKMDGTPRRLDGKYHPVWVFLRDYKTFAGLLMPTVYETTVEGVKTTEKINIENIVVNPKLADSRFAKLE